MAIQDKSLRSQAVPYSGQIFGYNHSENSDTDISMTLINPGTAVPGADPSLTGAGDLYPFVTNVSQTDYMIRILRPKYGQIIQAYLNLSLTFAAAEASPKINISVGNGFNTDNITPLVPTSTYIATCMKRLNPPNGTPFVGTAGKPLVVYNLNIQPLIPQVGDTNYVADFYTVGIHFLSAPTTGGLFHLSKFFVTGSIMVV